MSIRIGLLSVLLTLSSLFVFAEQNNVQSAVSLSVSSGLSEFFESGTIPCACELGPCAKPEIRFGRLKLRSAYESERRHIRELAKDPEVVRNYSLAEFASEREIDWLTTRLFQGPRHASLVDWGPSLALSFIIEDAGLMVGVGNIRRSVETKHWEIGYAIIKEFRRNGYATEAVEALLQFIRRTSVHGHVQATPLETNLSSQALLRKLGFQQETPPELEPNDLGVKQAYFVLRF